MRTHLYLPLILALLAVGFAMSPSETASGIKSAAIAFEKPEDLYFLFYEAHQSGIVSKNGDFYPSVFVEIIKTIPQLYTVAKDNHIIILNDQFSSSGLKTFISNDLALYNMLIQMKVLTPVGNFDQTKFAEILARYNPTTRTLDPETPLTKEEERKKEELAGKDSVRVPMENFTLEKVSDVYKLVLKAYQVGIFDKEGNFNEAKFVRFCKEEQFIAALLRNQGIIDTDFKVDYGAMRSFIEGRPTLGSLLNEAHVYKGMTVSKTAVSDIIHRYNEQTGKLDLPPLTPVVTQIVDEEDKIEKEDKTVEYEKQDFEKITADLFLDPISNLRHFLIALRKEAIFSTEGDFDAFAFHSIFSAIPSLSTLLANHAIFVHSDDEKAANKTQLGTVFKPANLLLMVTKNKELLSSALSLGVLSSSSLPGTYSYNQDAVAAIVESIPSPVENKKAEFSILDPTTIATTEDLFSAISFFYSMEVIAADGTFDLNSLLKLMKSSPSLNNYVMRTGVMTLHNDDGKGRDDNVWHGSDEDEMRKLKNLDLNTSSTGSGYLAVSIPQLRKTIISNPPLRITLCRNGILDYMGDFDRTQFVRTIARAVNTEVTVTTTNTVVKNATDIVEKEEEKPKEQIHVPELVAKPLKAISIEKKTNYTPLVLGLVFGLLLLIIIAIIVAVVLKKRKKKGAKKDEDYLSV